MRLLVESLVRRHVKHTSGFALSGGSCTDLGDIVALDERPIGIYRNPAPWDTEQLIFSDQAIYLVTSREIERLDVETISDCELRGTKEIAEGVVIKVKSRLLRVAGTHGPAGKFKDAYSLLMVLKAIVKSNIEGRTTRGDL